MFDLQYHFHNNILRHRRDISIIKSKQTLGKLLTPQCASWLCGMMHTTESDSAMGCTPRSFFRCFVFKTSQCDAHRGVWLRGMMHTAESDSAVGCTPRSFFKIRISQRNLNGIRKYISLFIRGLDEFESWKKWMSKISWHTPFKQCKMSTGE